ncbi:MAG: hypothetical protein F4Y12_01405 [Acidimicrobiaceae bacterium]|nr:hypothetical protein [Acidimicrobiaceae bacterium]MYH78193.1 hypothetical protein [Acidimicrobiaceae bacterium]MYK65319.1 hypothetical protein [Gemmatimonadota bacterium]
MTRSFRVSMTLMMLACAGISLAVAATMVADRPAPAALMAATGVAVLVMTRFAWRWMADPADWRDCG